MFAYFVSIYFFFYLQSIAQNHADTVDGIIYTMNNHGYVFYVSEVQYILWNTLCYGGLLTCVAFGVLFNYLRET